MAEKKEKKKLGLSTTIFLSLIIGALFGVVIHYWVPESYFRDTVLIEGILYVVGQGFIRLMQMLVVPLVFCSLVCGSMAIGDTKNLGKVGVKTIGFYIATTALAVTIALSVAYVIDPGVGLDMDAIEVAEVSSTTSSTSIVDTLLNIIPKNPIGSMADGDMLPIIVFALFVGVMLAKLGSKADVVATSNATIPMSIDTLHKKMGVSKQISSFTIPLGATINMDGTSIMQGVAVVFIAQAFGIELSMANLATVVLTATIASIGTAGVPSVGLVTLAMVLTSVGLPTEGIALIMGIDRILDMLRTAVNITGDAVCTTIVSHQEGALDREVFNRD